MFKRAAFINTQYESKERVLSEAELNDFRGVIFANNEPYSSEAQAVTSD